MSDVYYRIYYSLRDDEIVIVCMQDFDECDYDQSRFLSEKHFESEDAATDYVRKMRDTKELPIQVQNLIDKFLGINLKNILD